MNRIPTLIFASVATIALAGCAGSSDSRELTQKMVEYECGPGGEQPLTVQYTFQGTEALSARVVHMNQAVEMVRVTSNHADMVANTFRGAGYTWTTGAFDIDNVEDVDGDMLTQAAPVGAAQSGNYGTVSDRYAGTHGGQTGVVGTVLLRDCRVS
ncbi:MAG: hypothetical protein GX772_06005 [Alcaligenaceae bacterium]|nr:hypothetical protein [Alcaligenaceae bacterium]